MDVLLCTWEKKRQNFYVPVTFTSVQDWNNCDLFAQA